MEWIFLMTNRIIVGSFTGNSFHPSFSTKKAANNLCFLAVTSSLVLYAVLGICQLKGNDYYPHLNEEQLSHVASEQVDPQHTHAHTKVVCCKHLPVKKQRASVV